MPDWVREIVQRRKRYRVKYPYAERPKLAIRGAEPETVDISENAIRLKFEPGQRISVTITFRDGESLDLEGEIQRLRRGEVVLTLSTPIAYERIVKEERHLMNRYVGYR